MAMAKQQQFHSEQQLQQQLALAQSKRKPHGGGGGQGAHYGSFAYSSTSQASGENSVQGSPQLKNAGAMVLHQPERRLL